MEVQARFTDPSSSWRPLLLGLVNLPTSKTSHRHMGRKGRVKDCKRGCRASCGQASKYRDLRHGDQGFRFMAEESSSSLRGWGTGQLDPRRTLHGARLSPGDWGQPGWVVRAPHPLEATLQSSKASGFSPLHLRSPHPITFSFGPLVLPHFDHTDRCFLGAEGRNSLVYSLVGAGLH